MKKKILILILSVFLVVPLFSVDAINYKNDYDNFDKNSIELLAKNNGESYLENDEQEMLDKEQAKKEQDCRKNLLGEAFAEDLDYVFNAIMIATPFIVIGLVIKDFVVAVMAGKEDEMKKAQKNAITRIVIGVIIEFTPVIVNTILNLVGQFSGTCGIG